MTRVFKYILMLNFSLALVSVLGSAWSAQTVGSSAYLAGAVATIVVGIAASLALVLSYIHSRRSDKDSSVSAILLAMLIRMGVPLVVMAIVQQQKSSLLASGFMGLLALNYFWALALETIMSLRILNGESVSASSQPALDEMQT